MRPTDCWLAWLTHALSWPAAHLPRKSLSPLVCSRVRRPAAAAASLPRRRLSASLLPRCRFFRRWTQPSRRRTPPPSSVLAPTLAESHRKSLDVDGDAVKVQ